jgi:phosphoinositide-3-kinase regulatory subunit 4
VASYDLHRGEVLDAATIENSHSVASVSSDGAVHVWRVELQGSGGAADYVQDEFVSSMSNLAVKDRSLVRVLDPAEGAVLCVNHFNSDVCSIVTYATQRGGLHGWDLRAAREVMRLPVRPELGYTTSMTVSPDRNWVCLGTSKGFVSLFDIRYNVPSKLWRHSSHSAIHRLACCKAPRMAVGTAGANVAVPPQSEGAFLFVAAGNNEAAVWGIPEGGECCKSFRSIPLDCSRGPVAPLPVLEDVPLRRHPHAPVSFQDSAPRPLPSGEDAVRAIIGRISQSNMSYLVTAGTDRSIRFWDFSSPTRCFTVSGLEPAQPKAIFDAPKLADGSSGKLFVCYVAATPSADKILQMHLPVREGRGIVLPSVNAKVKRVNSMVLLWS